MTELRFGCAQDREIRCARHILAPPRPLRKSDIAFCIAQSDLTSSRIYIDCGMAQKRSSEVQRISGRVQRELGARLQEQRKAKGRGQADFGEAMELTRTSVSNLERGTQRVFLDQVYRAAYVLGVPIESLLPAMDDIFPERAIHSAPDDPISANTMAAVSRLIEGWRSQPVEARGGIKRALREKSANAKRPAREPKSASRKRPAAD